MSDAKRLNDEIIIYPEKGRENNKKATKLKYYVRSAYYAHTRMIQKQKR